MADKSFIDVLEAQIRADLRAEIEAEVRAQFGMDAATSAFTQKAPQGPTGAADRLETWLATHLEKTFFSTSEKARREYGAANHTKKTPPAAGPSSTQFNRPQSSHQGTPREPRVTVTRVEDLCRLELFRRNGATLDETFSLSELKTAWRKAALKTHPDRFAQADQKTQFRMAAVFREVASAFAELEAHFHSHTKPQANHPEAA